MGEKLKVLLKQVSYSQKVKTISSVWIIFRLFLGQDKKPMSSRNVNRMKLDDCEQADEEEAE
jgi:hypothetical protein